MTGLRVPPGPASGARPDEGATPDAPTPPTANPSSFGLVGWARWGWRQLTSMRTALVLLFLLAVASVPGSLLPQQGIDPAAALGAATALLRRRKFRLRTGDGWVSAEKGYRRELGNLVFHLALLALLCSVALGGLFGYKANRLLVSGTSFANTVTALDEFRPGRLVSSSDL